MPRRIFFLLVFLPFLTACNTYHPLKGGVGFTEVPIGPDTFQITYAGAMDKSIAEARRYAYLRAAELAALRGEPYFQVLSEHVYVSWGYYYWPGASYTFADGYGPRRGYGYGYPYRYYDPGYVEPYSLPEVVMQIQLFPNPGPSTIPAAYLLNQAIRDKVKLSPGVAEKLSTMPEVTTPVTLPPPPAATTKPATAPTK